MSGNGSYLWLGGVGERGMFRSRKLLDASQDQTCKVCIPGVCTSRRDTVVAAHSNWQSEGRGHSFKSHDWATVDACSACHDELDRGTILPDEEKRRYFLEGFIRTMGARFARGIVKVA